MIQHPALLAAVLVGIVALVHLAARTPALRWAFIVTPIPFWCYVLPMVGTTLGWWPATSPLYTTLSQYLLPICLVLLLIGTDLPALARLSRSALIVMLAGSVGIMGGMVLAVTLWHRWLPATAWMGLGALAGSWTGGSMNLLAVKEALNMPDAAIAPIIVVDTIVAYSWMALLLLLSSCTSDASRRPVRGVSGPVRHSSLADEAERARCPESASVRWRTRDERGRASSEDRGTRPVDGSRWAGSSGAGRTTPSKGRRGIGLLAATAIAALITWVAGIAGRALPTTASITTSTWTILLVTTITLAASLTPLAKLERDHEVSRLGLLCLFVLLASIGARVEAHALRQAPIFLAAGVTAVLVHAVVLGLVGWWLRAPLGLLATASQANVGGVVSAPLVAAAYDRQLAPLGLLMAVFGNVIGTYCGLATAALCRAVSA